MKTIVFRAAFSAFQVEDSTFFIVGECIERFCCLTARRASSVGGLGFAKVLGSSEHVGARRSKV